MAHGTGLIPNETQFPCPTLVACLGQAVSDLLEYPATHAHQIYLLSYVQMDALGSQALDRWCRRVAVDAPRMG